MNKAEAWQAKCGAARQARQEADAAKPTFSEWEPYALQVKAEATGVDELTLSTQKSGATIVISDDTAVKLAHWIIETWGR